MTWILLIILAWFLSRAMDRSIPERAKPFFWLLWCIGAFVLCARTGDGVLACLNAVCALYRAPECLQLLDRKKAEP
jgi:hypothetical protein